MRSSNNYTMLYINIIIINNEIQYTPKTAINFAVSVAKVVANACSHT